MARFKPAQIAAAATAMAGRSCNIAAFNVLTSSGTGAIQPERSRSWIHRTAVIGDLDSVKATIDRRLSRVELSRVALAQKATGSKCSKSSLVRHADSAVRFPEWEDGERRTSTT